MPLTTTVPVTVVAPSLLHPNQFGGAVQIVDQKWTTWPTFSGGAGTYSGLWQTINQGISNSTLVPTRPGMRGDQSVCVSFKPTHRGGTSPVGIKYWFSNPAAHGPYTKWRRVYHHFQIELANTGEGTIPADRGFCLRGPPGVDPISGIPYTSGNQQLKVYWPVHGLGIANGPFFEMRAGARDANGNTTAMDLFRYNAQATASQGTPGDPKNPNVNPGVIQDFQNYSVYDIEIEQVMQTDINQTLATADGQLRWWVNGVKRGEHLDMLVQGGTVNGFGAFKLEMQYGGWANPPIQNVVGQQMNVFWGAVYVSGEPA